MPPVHIPSTFSSLLRQACTRLSYPLLMPPAQTLVSPSSHPSHDYQTNVPVSLAKSTRQPPPKVAASLQAQLTPELQGVAVISITAGFLNFRLEDGWLQAQIAGFDTSSHPPPIPQDHPSPTTLLDYASPNVGKELHVGHLRSAVIGDTLARVLEYVGQRPVVRHSHVGDCGLPVALVVNAYLRQQQQPQAVQSDSPPLPTPAQLSAMYVEEKQRGREGASAASTTLVSLQKELAGQAPRTPLYTAWERVCRASREGYTPLFSALNVSVEERGESCYIGAVEGVVAELVGKGVAVEDGGALIVRLAAPQSTPSTGAATAPPPTLPPMLIRKADGGYLYATTDLACLRARLVSGLQHIVYITDAAQSLHFTQLFAAARVAGWVDGSTDPPTNTLAPGHPPITLTHAPFGVVVGESGKKLSSREGGVDLTSLASLLEAASRYSLEVMERGVAGEGESVSEGGGTAALPPPSSAAASQVLTPQQREQESRRVGASVIRFFDLMHRRDSTYAFSMERAFSVKGRSAAYPLYALARLRGVREGGGVLVGAGGETPATWGAIAQAMATAIEECSGRNSSSGSGSSSSSSPPYGCPSERALALAVLSFSEATATTARTLDPHHLTDYTLRLATAFHAFYSTAWVLPPPNTPRGGPQWAQALQRVRLCAATEDALRTAMDLCGMERVERL